MAFQITEDCISCGACESECPIRQSVRVTQLIKSTPINALNALGLTILPNARRFVL